MPNHQDDFDWNQSYTGEVTDFAEADPELLKIIDGLPPGRALDVGCGAGGLVVALARRGWTVTGIDLAEKAVEAARKVVQMQGVAAELQVADATAWTPAGPYDLITSSFALPRTRTGRAALFSMIRGALAPGGTVLLKDFDPSMSRIEFFSGFDLVTLEELTGAFSGFDIIRAEVVETPVHHHGTGGGEEEERWTAALLQARSP